jgi:glutamate carboxypeptidase
MIGLRMAPAATDEMLDWLAGQRDAMLDLLAQIVNIDSGTRNKQGTDRVGDCIAAFLRSHDVAVEILPQLRHGNCVRASVGGDASRNDPGYALLIAHMDTVFADGEAWRRPFTIADGKAFGPGVLDMKAGAVLNAFVLAAFQRFGGNSSPVVALFTGDEEITSPEGRPLLEREARGARAVFNTEPSRLSGATAIGRKGAVFMTIEITGKSAHAGGYFTDGISAIQELALKIQALHALTDLEHDVTVNVGLVSGGQSVNTVAPEARCEIDLRFITPADRDRVMASIHEIAARSFVPGTTASLSIQGEFLPLVATDQSRRLYDLYATSTRVFGLEAEPVISGGCSDSGFTASVGAPTLCGLGPLGAHPHSPDEFILVDTMVPRAQALARTIMNIADFS